MKRRLSIPLTLGLIAGSAVYLSGVAQAASTLYVNDDAAAGTNASCSDPGFNTIGAAVAAAADDYTIEVCAGTYAENVVLNKRLTLHGAQAGADARGRSADELIIAPASGIGLNLKGGSAGSTIDGFAFTGGSSAIRSGSGPIDEVTIANNRMSGFTGAAVFLDDSGTDITIDQNAIDASSKTGGGGTVHLDTDNFAGLHFTNNDVTGPAPGTGFFVDGNHNVGASDDRSPLISGNVFDGHETGANLGTRAFANGEISGNTFSNNDSPGLQGGIQHTMIEGNTFEGNGRYALELTSFGNTNADRGAQYDTITHNTFTNNGGNPHPVIGGGAIYFSASQAAGTISTNTVNENDVVGNLVGASYSGSETIDVQCNWWGDASGPSGNGNGSGDAVDGATLSYVPWLVDSFTNGGDCTGRPDQKAEGHGKFVDDEGNTVEFKFKVETKHNELKGDLEVKVKDELGESDVQDEGHRRR